MDSNIRILAVDDEPDIRQLLRILLENRGYQVTEASSGEEALRSLRTDPSYDLILMDIMMPGLDGVEACRAIRSFSTAPVLFLTAKTQLGDKASAYDSGGDDFLPKPFSQTELLMKVESLIRRYRVYKGKREAVLDASLQLDEDRRCAVKNGQVVELTSKEYEILQYFFHHRGKVLDVRSVYEGAEVYADFHQYRNGPYLESAKKAGRGSGQSQAHPDDLGEGVSIWLEGSRAAD